MSHCTKYDFTYSNEEAIVKAFGKMNIKCSTEIVSTFATEIGKKFLSKIGYIGIKQCRAIVGKYGVYQLFACKVAEDKYELLVEYSGQIGAKQEREMKEIEKSFRIAYMSVAVDKIVKKLKDSGMSSSVRQNDNRFIVEFGPLSEYSVTITFDNNQIIEDVHGVKGDFCTKLTEDIEDLLSSPVAELQTEWKVEYTMPVEEQALQVLSLNF